MALSPEMENARRQTAVANRILAYVGLASGVRASLGHTSFRVPGDPDHFYVKGRGYRMDILSRMRPEDMVLCDLEGRWVDGPENSTPCNEVKMHSCIYKNRPDVLSVTHVHPTFSVVLSTIGQPIRPIAQEGIALVRKPVPVYPHCKTVVTEEEGQDVAKLLGDGTYVLLQGHGTAVVGRSPQESVLNTMHIEHQAQMTYYALSAMGPNFKAVPDEVIEEMVTFRQPLPHFQERLAQLGDRRGQFGGIWPYLAEQVSAGL